MAVNADSSQPRYIFGPYEITDTLGHGGMGVVYRAVDTSLGRPVALKILREDLRSRSRVVARFEREAKAFASLDHPNIVHIHSVGVIGKIPYIAMEFIDGATLGDRLQANGPMPWREAFRVGVQVADALASAHEAGIIHRDIKPGNILMNRQDKAYVTDFGIAKILTATTKLTVDGTRLGTPQYMSPERCRDEAVTPASDLYALGVLLFQAISGRLPHEGGSNAEVIKRIVSDPPARLSRYVPEVPAPVERLVAYLLERKPNDRPGSASAVKVMLEQVIVGKSFAADREEMTHALDAYRRSLDVETPRREAAGSETPTEVTTGHGKKRPWLRGPLLVAVAAMLLVLLIGGALASNRLVNMPGGLRLPLQNDATQWTAVSPVAAWHRETDTVSLLRHAARDLRVSEIRAHAGNLHVVLRNGGEAGMLLVDPTSRSAHYMIAPGDALGTVVDATATGDRPQVIVRTSNALALVGMPSNPWEPAVMSRVYAGPLDAVAVYTPESWKGDPNVALARDAGSERWLVEEFSVDAPQRLEPVMEAPGPVTGLAYNDSGSMLAAVVDVTSERSELRVRRFFSADTPEAVIAEGVLALPVRPFQPDGTDVLVRLGAGATRWSILNSETGARRNTLKDVVNAAWAPDGRTLLVVAPDRGGRDQLWRLAPAQPGNREQLTFLAEGVGANLAVDRASTRACVSLPNGDGVALVDLR